MEVYKTHLKNKIRRLHESLWEGRANGKEIEQWLQNFNEGENGGEKEKLHALFLLSNFMYFGTREIRELLKAIYRDLYKYPIIKRIRRSLSDTLDTDKIEEMFQVELKKSRFLAVGNPSESGHHLLYYFRQENRLSKDVFTHLSETFSIAPTGPITLKDPTIRNYVFIDDFCGSGQQAAEYLSASVSSIKALNPDAVVSYCSILGTKDGVSHLRNNVQFDKVEPIFLLDETYRSFAPQSRFFDKSEAFIDKTFAMAMCYKYGGRIWPVGCDQIHYLGWRDGQLLIGFHHNVPDNTLPIIWGNEEDSKWHPIFKRFPKFV